VTPTTAGFNKDKPVSDSGPTKTFDNSNEPGSAVTDKAWPSTQRGSAKQGVQPGDPVFKPDERVDVEKNGPTPNPQRAQTSGPAQAATVSLVSKTR
jgi:hypothetical protein